MTKKELKWRLKTAPTPHDVNNLVDGGIISKEEARNIFFNEQEPDKETDHEKDLKKQIKFLEELVKELSKSQVNYPVITPVYVEKWIKKNPWEPTYIYCATTTSSSSSIGATGTPGYIQTSLGNYTQNLIG